MLARIQSLKQQISSSDLKSSKIAKLACAAICEIPFDCYIHLDVEREAPQLITQTSLKATACCVTVRALVCTVSVVYTLEQSVMRTEDISKVKEA